MKRLTKISVLMSMFVLQGYLQAATPCTPEAAKAAGQRDAEINDVGPKNLPKCTGSYSLTSYKKDYLGGVQSYKLQNCTMARAQELGRTDGVKRSYTLDSKKKIEVCLQDANLFKGLESAHLSAFQKEFCTESQARLLGEDDFNQNRPEKESDFWVSLCREGTEKLDEAYESSFERRQVASCSPAAAMEAGILDQQRHSTEGLNRIKNCPRDSQKELLESYEKGTRQRRPEASYGNFVVEKSRDSSFTRNTLLRGNERLETFCMLNESWGVASVVLLNSSRRLRTLGSDLEIEFYRGQSSLRRGVLESWRKGKSIPAYESVYFEVQAPEGTQSCKIR